MAGVGNDEPGKAPLPTPAASLGTISFSHQWTEDAWLRMVQEYRCVVLKQKLAWFVLRWVTGPAVLLCLGYWVIMLFRSSEAAPPATMAPVDLGAFYLVLLPWLVAWALAVPVSHWIHGYLLRRAFRANPVLSLVQTWRIDRASVQMTTVQNSEELKWSAVVSVRELRDGFWLSRGGQLGLWVPKQSLELAAQLDAFRALLKLLGLSPKS